MAYSPFWLLKSGYLTRMMFYVLVFVSLFLLPLLTLNVQTSEAKSVNVNVNDPNMALTFTKNLGHLI
jgi:hypothetical protein